MSNEVSQLGGKSECKNQKRGRGVCGRDWQCGGKVGDCFRGVMFRALVQASVNATRRAVAWNLKDISPPSEQTLFRFAAATDLSQWEVYSDSELGGLSTASLQLSGDQSGVGKAGVFTGNLSLELTDDSSIRMKRSGFSGIRTVEGKHSLDLEPFDTIALRLKGDGRCYLSSIRTENWMGGPGAPDSNTWQAFVFAPQDEWCVVKIPLARYLPTWKGKIVDSNNVMNTTRVVGMGLSLSAEGGPEGILQGPGPFRLELDWIKALRIS